MLSCNLHVLTVPHEVCGDLVLSAKGYHAHVWNGCSDVEPESLTLWVEDFSVCVSWNLLVLLMIWLLGREANPFFRSGRLFCWRSTLVELSVGWAVFLPLALKCLLCMPIGL